MTEQQKTNMKAYYYNKGFKDSILISIIIFTIIYLII